MINWEMGVSDPLKGVNSGLASLGQSLQAQQALERQSKLDSMNMDLHGLEAQKARLTLADLQRKQNQDSQLQALLSNPQTIPATPAVSNVSQPSPSIQGLSGLRSLGQLGLGQGAPSPTMEDPMPAASSVGFPSMQPPLEPQ